MLGLSEKPSVHRMRYAARAEIATACSVDDTLQQMFVVSSRVAKKPSGCPKQHEHSNRALCYLLSQSSLSLMVKVVYDLTDALDRYGESLNSK